MPPPQGTWNPIEGPGDYTTTRIVHNDSYPAIDPTKADFTGKAIFISGASRGLGRSTALSFAKAGASHIAIAARSDLTNVAEEIRRAAVNANRQQPAVLCLHLDISSEPSVTKAFETITKTFGKLDVLINNAGIIGARSTIGDSTPSSWWQTFTTNVHGPFLTLRAALPLLLQSTLKTAITITSVGAFCVSPTLSDYQTSKLAALRLTEFFHAENAAQGVIAFSVHPGNILTDIVGKGEGMEGPLKAVFTESVELCGDSLVFLSGERRQWLGGRYVNCTWDLPELVEEGRRRQIVEGDLLKVRLATAEF